MEAAFPTLPYQNAVAELATNRQRLPSQRGFCFGGDKVQIWTYPKLRHELPTARDVSAPTAASEKL